MIAAEHACRSRTYSARSGTLLPESEPAQIDEALSLRGALTVESIETGRSLLPDKALGRSGSTSSPGSTTTHLCNKRSLFELYRIESSPWTSFTPCGQ